MHGLAKILNIYIEKRLEKAILIRKNAWTSKNP